MCLCWLLLTTSHGGSHRRWACLVACSNAARPAGAEEGDVGQIDDAQPGLGSSRACRTAVCKVGGRAHVDPPQAGPIQITKSPAKRGGVRTTALGLSRD